MSLARRPFVRLVVHFLARLVRGGRESESEFELGLAPLLGLLFAPGAFCSIILFDKYSSITDYILGRRTHDIYTYSIPDKYFFICLAMAVAGVVTVLKWDKILPDAQDYLNLSPLPLRSRTILLANAAAIAIAVLVFSLDVNGSSALLFPAIVSNYTKLGGGVLLSFAAVHAAVLMLATLFTFCSIFAALGLLSAALPIPLFRAISGWIRGLVVVCSIAMLLSVSAGPGWLRAVERHPDSAARFIPAVWFLGLYQNWQHRSNAGIAALASTALAACAIAFALMAVSYALSYRRRFAAVLESARPSGRQWTVAAALRLLDLFSANASAFDRACHRFVIRAMLRDETHRLAIAVSAGLGWLFALEAISSGSALARLAAPLAAAYPLLLGLRIASEIPAGIPSNWVFRVTLDPRAHETSGLTLRVLLTFLIPIVVLPAFVIGVWQLGIVYGAIHGLYVFAICAALGEALFAGHRKIPLTTPMPALPPKFAAMALLHIAAFAVFTQLGGRIEADLLAVPALLPLVPAALGGVWYWNRRRIQEARANGEWEEGFTFDSTAPPAVERLDLFDASLSIPREAPPSGQPW